MVLKKEVGILMIGDCMGLSVVFGVGVEAEDIVERNCDGDGHPGLFAFEIF